MSSESDRLAEAVIQDNTKVALKLLKDTQQAGGSCGVHQLVEEATANLSS